MENVKPSLVLVVAPRVGSGFEGMSVTGPTEFDNTGVPPPFTLEAFASTFK
jgi:hypothetical protein